MRLICLFFIGMFFSLSGESQSFDYTFEKDSVAWQELNSQTILNTDNSAWNFSYQIPIGFSFNYLGRSFDSLTIETNSYLVFDANRNYAFTAFLGFGDCVDTNGNHSVLGYELSGSAGNHILKIQFKNTGSEKMSLKHFSYQIWLKENGVVEVHVGPNDFQRAIIVHCDSSYVNSVLLDAFDQPTDSLVIVHDILSLNGDSALSYRIGLLNMNMNGAVNGLFIGGTVSSPQSQATDENHPDPIFLVRAPSQGTRYSFTPNSN